MTKPHSTKLDILRCGTALFLEKGYNATTPKMLCQELDISPGNLTYYYPTKEHLLAELVKLLCSFQREMIQKETEDGYTSVMAICLELLTMASACEQDKVVKDFFLSAYRSELCMELIREQDKERAKEVFKEYCSDWTEEYFCEAEALVSGIEYATFFTTSNSAPLGVRVGGAIKTILSIYNVPKEIRDKKVHKVLTMDYKTLGLDTLKQFKKYVDKTTEQSILALLK